MSDDIKDLLPPLDGDAGPAPPIDAATAQKMVDAVLAQQKPWWKAAWVPPVVGVTGVLAVVIAVATMHRAPQPTTTTVARPPNVTQPPTDLPQTQSDLPGTNVVDLPVTTPPPMRPIDPPARPQSSDDLLRQANKLRADKKWIEARDTYDRVSVNDPKSDQAYTALIAGADLRLEHLNDAGGALRAYQLALATRPDGPLSEEARLGIASAYRSLGRASDEMHALDEFLKHHPQSLSAPQARARLAKLQDQEK